MGQQQLLLVILVTILVGIATVVAINVFGTAAEEGNRDAVRQDLLQAAAGAQAVYTRPEALGGAGGDFTDTDALQPREIMSALQIPGSFVDPLGGPTVTNWENENAEYTVATTNEYTLTVTAVPVSWNNDIVMQVCRDGVDRQWKYDITTDGSAPDAECAPPAT